MKTLSRFVVKFTSLITAVLSCFDRVIFKGYLPIAMGSALETFVDHVLKIRRVDFMAFAEKQAETLVEHAKRLAQQAGAEYRFLQGAHRKDNLVDEILRKRPISEGLIAVFCRMECCGSFRLIGGKDRPCLVNARRQQRVLYFYYWSSTVVPETLTAPRVKAIFPCVVSPTLSSNYDAWCHEI